MANTTPQVPPERGAPHLPPGAPPVVAPPVAPSPAYPGGMASDPTLAVANDIATFVMGAADRHRGEDPDEVKAKIIGEIANKVKEAIRASLPADAPEKKGV